MSIHWFEKVKDDPSHVPLDQLIIAKAELSADVVSIECGLGDHNKCHPDGTRMTTVEWNSWFQKTKRALKHKLDALIKAKAELELRKIAGRQAVCVLKDLIAELAGSPVTPKTADLMTEGRKLTTNFSESRKSRAEAWSGVQAPK